MTRTWLTGWKIHMVYIKKFIKNGMYHYNFVSFTLAFVFFPIAPAFLHLPIRNLNNGCQFINSFATLIPLVTIPFTRQEAAQPIRLQMQLHYTKVAISISIFFFWGGVGGGGTTFNFLFYNMIHLTSFN